MKYRQLALTNVSVSLILLIILIVVSISNAIEPSNEPELTKEVSDADASEVMSTLELSGVGRSVVTEPMTSETDAVEETEVIQNENNISTVQEDTSVATEIITEEVTTEESIMEVTTFNDLGLQEIYEFTKQVAEYYYLDPLILMKVMKVESNFDPYAVSSTGDHGICQINENWYHRYLTWDDPFSYIVEASGGNLYDTKTNIVIATRQMSAWFDYAVSQGYTGYEYLEFYNKGYRGAHCSDYQTKVLNAEIN